MKPEPIPGITICEVELQREFLERKGSTFAFFIYLAWGPVEFTQSHLVGKYMIWRRVLKSNSSDPWYMTVMRH